MQLHLPSHTTTTADLPTDGMNSTNGTSHDWYCNRPAILNFWGELPPKHKVHGLLERDRNKRSGITLNDTLEAHKGKEKSGKDPVQARSLPSPYQDIITIAHKLPAVGLSASELCDDALSMGPDFVNLPKGKFCRMSDKTLWPT